MIEPSRLKPAQIKNKIKLLKNWKYIPASDEHKQTDAIARTFEFKDFHETMGFVNAVAWIANSQNHHPDLQVTYKTCSVNFSTHDVLGLSEKDFIAAAKVDALLTK